MQYRRLYERSRKKEEVVEEGEIVEIDEAVSEEESEAQPETVEEESQEPKNEDELEDYSERVKNVFLI